MSKNFKFHLITFHKKFVISTQKIGNVIRRIFSVIYIRITIPFLRSRALVRLNPKLLSDLQVFKLILLRLLTNSGTPETPNSCLLIAIIAGPWNRYLNHCWISGTSYQQRNRCAFIAETVSSLANEAIESGDVNGNSRNTHNKYRWQRQPSARWRSEDKVTDPRIDRA